MPKRRKLPPRRWSELKEKVTVIQSQISVLKGQIAEVQNSIGVEGTGDHRQGSRKAEKEAEIADQWDDFKSHGRHAGAAGRRQRGHAGAVNDLYELLTFNEVMQDISMKDTEILDNMKNCQGGAGNDKLSLEEAHPAAEQKGRAGRPEQPDAVQAERAQLQRLGGPDERG